MTRAPTVQRAARAALDEELEAGAIAFLIVSEDGAGKVSVRSIPEMHSTRIGLLHLAMSSVGTEVVHD